MDILRILSMGVIVVYHFFKGLVIMQATVFTDPDIVMNGPSVHLVILAVGVFFMLSGAGLSLSMEKKESLTANAGAPAFDFKSYYFGRFSQILIPFYIAYIGVLAERLIRGRINFYGVPLPSILLTVLGMDEYGSALGLRTFSVGVGEWFLGCLMLMYLVFPFIYLLMKKWDRPVLIVSCLSFIILSILYDPSYGWHMSFCIRLFEFILGMWFIKNRRLMTSLNNSRFTPVYIIFILFALAQSGLVPIPRAVLNTVAVSCIFVGSLVLELTLRKDEDPARVPGQFERLLSMIGGYCFYVYLVHHEIIYILAERLATRMLGR